MEQMKDIIKFIAIIVILFSFPCYGKEKAMILDWQIGYHKDEHSEPHKWMAATVPGAVQLDVMKAENYKQPYWYDNNVQQFDWMEDYYFTYKAFFKKPSFSPDQRVFFFSKGIDYSFKIILNDIPIKEQEGMFSYVDLDLTDYLKEENELRIIVFPVPKTGVSYQRRTESYRQNARESVKPAVSYGWDWHPRLVTRGIWDETYLVVRNVSRVTDSDISYKLNEDLSVADISIDLKGSCLEGKKFEYFLKDPTGEIVFHHEGKFSTDSQRLQFTLMHPLLWWPVGYGEPHLYLSEIHLMDSSGNFIQKDVDRIGFRQIKLVKNEGAEMVNVNFPKTRDPFPAQLEINNRRIFAKGTNWVHPEIFVGLITPERYNEQILLAKRANFNILRVWGGGIVNKESFFDLCDENGILIWQEFPLACNNYSNDEKYLKVLEQEATSIIKRVKKHACLAIWCGGNELFNSWSGMTDQSLALRLLNSLCFRLDPSTPFMYTSPLYGMGHGHYLFYDKNTREDVFQWMSISNFSAYSEFGVPGVSNLSVLKSFIPSDQLFPPREDTAWEFHHGLYAWQEDSWLELPTLEYYFGEIGSLEELVSYSQLLQCEGVKFIYEEARRQRPYCSMALNWCFQEPWPTAANNSLINWPNDPKPAYYHVANACRPILASIRFPKFQWEKEEEFSCDVFMLNDTYSKVEPARVSVVLIYDKGKELNLLDWDFSGSNGFRNIKGPTIKIKLPKIESQLFAVKIKVVGKEEYNSTYILLNKSDNASKIIPPKSYFRGETDFQL